MYRLASLCRSPGDALFSASGAQISIEERRKEGKEKKKEEGRRKKEGGRRWLTNASRPPAMEACPWAAAT
jgi:hypothetical protein